MRESAGEDGKKGARDSTLPPFRPPYFLSGSALVAVGWWRTSRSPGQPPSASGPGVLIVYHYTEPPTELPLVYREVIAACLVRDGLWLAAEPFDMVLDEELPVQLGREHYGMPKRYDSSLRAHGHGPDFFVRGERCVVHWQARGALLSLLALPLRWAFALGVWLFTRLFGVLGTGPRKTRAQVALRPHALGDVARMVDAEVGHARLHTLWASHFKSITTRLGRPRELR